MTTATKGNFDGGSPSLLRASAAPTEQEQAERRKRHQRAVICVASRATDPDDFLDLLDMLGLNPSEGKRTS